MSSTYSDLSCAFPDNIDPNRNFVDVNISNKSYVDSYMSAVSSGDFTTATSIMSSHNDLKDIIINASVIQLLYDMNIANQRIYKSDFQTYIANAVKYKGTYSATTTYSFLNVVSYNYKAYMCFANSAINVLPTDSSTWVLMSIVGPSSTGMSFYTSWSSDVTYKIQDCVPYGNKLYVSIADSNINHIPSDSSSSSFWKQIVVVPRQIVWSNTQPTNQELYDIWYKTNSTDSSYEIYECQGNDSYVQKFPVSNANFIKCTDGSTVQKKLEEEYNELASHKSDASAHITTLSCTKTGTVYALTGLTATASIVSCVFKADTAYAAGDTFTVDGTAVTAQQQNGDNLDDGCFKSGAAVPCIYDVGNKTLNFKQSGGTKLNLFVQPDEPATKDGIWLKSATKEDIKKVVFDTNVWASGQWQNPSNAIDLPRSLRSSCCAAVGDDIFIFGGYDDNNNMLTAIYKYNTISNTISHVQDFPRQTFGACCVAIGKYIYIFGGQTGTNWHSDRCLSIYVYKFDTLSNTLYALRDLPTAEEYSCAAIGNFIYLFPFNKNTCSCYKYDIEKNDYSAIATIPSSYDIHLDINVYAYNGFIYIIGGGNKDTYSSYVLRYNVQTNTYTSLSNLNSNYSNGTIIGDKIFLLNSSHTIIYDIPNDTYESYSKVPRYSGYGMFGCTLVNDTVYVFGLTDKSTINYTLCNKIDCFKLTSKQYLDSPTFIIYYAPSDSTYMASILKNKKIDNLPVFFKDCMLFKDGEITYPALYTGNGTKWTLVRSAH